MAFFDKIPGSPVLPSTEDQALSLVTDGDLIPNSVRLPPSMGGFHVAVLGGGRIPCPCGGGHDALNLELAHEGINVAECANGEFLWYRRAS